MNDNQAEERGQSVETPSIDAPHPEFTRGRDKGIREVIEWMWRWGLPKAAAAVASYFGIMNPPQP